MYFEGKGEKGRGKGGDEKTIYQKKKRLGGNSAPGLKLNVSTVGKASLVPQKNPKW